MQDTTQTIDFSFDYPAGCTRAQLRTRLESLALNWPGWDNYPWRITRNIHRFINTPPVTFHYLQVRFCIAGHAAHVILNASFEDRNEVLDMMIREKFQFIGVCRLMLIDALRYEMRFTKLPYIRDCTGPEEGHDGVSVEELQTRRRMYRECIEGAERDFVRILNLASQTEDMGEWLFGRPLHGWARGGDLPVPVELQVRIEEKDGMKIIWPRKKEAVEILKAGKKVPKIEVRAERAVPRDALRMPSAGKGPRANEAEPGDEARRLVGMAMSLAQQLDGNPRVKAPNHITVLKMYCVDEMSVGQIKKKCKCGHGTVMNRKKTLEKKLGCPLDEFRGMGGTFEGMAATLEDRRAKKIYRRGLANGCEEEDEPE